MLQAYAAGVNAGLGALDAKPFEYFPVNQTPRLWALEDTILAIHAMWITLTDEAAERDLNLTRMYDVLPPEVYAYLTQVGSKQDAALDGSSWSSLPIPAAQVYDARRFGETLVHSAILPVALHRDAHLEGLQGSNNWAVMGRRSTHGGAIVANDMHLSLRVPNLWFRARFVIPGLLDISGVSLPGAPAIVAGSNGKLAWGFTNSYVDTADLVRLELDPNNPRRYRTRDGYRNFSVRKEVVQIAGGDATTINFDETIWGPVRNADGQRYAVQWMARAANA